MSKVVVNCTGKKNKTKKNLKLKRISCRMNK